MAGTNPQTSSPDFIPDQSGATPDFIPHPADQQAASPETQLPGMLGSVARFGQEAKPYFQTLGREASAAGSAIKGMFSPPSGAMSPEEQQNFPLAANAPGPLGSFGQLGLLANRMVGEPIANAAAWYTKAAQGKIPNPVDQMLSVLPEAVGTGAGTEVGGKLIDSAAGRGAAVKDVVDTRAALSSAIDHADGLTRQAKTLNVIDKTAQKLFNNVGDSIRVLHDKFTSDAQKSIQPLIDADKASGAKPVATHQAAIDAASAISKTDYTPTRLEQELLDKISESPEDNIAKQLGYPNAETARAQVGAVVFNDFLQKGAGGVNASGLDLDSTLKLRTAIGKAAARSKDPAGQLVMKTAYKSMTDDLNRRFNEVQGIKDVDSPNKAFKQYNENHQAAFKLEDSKSFTSKFLNKPLDHHEAREQLPDFVSANLTQVGKQMADKGMNAKAFYRMQQDAKSIMAAHDSTMGKFNKSVVKTMMSGDAKQAALPIGVYAMSKGAGLYGLVPYMLASIAGKLPQEFRTMTDFTRVMKRLGVSDAAINTRPQPGPFVPTEIDPFNRFRNQPLEPEQPNFTPGRPSIERIAPNKAQQVQAVQERRVNPPNYPTTESRRASDAAFAKNYPNESMKEPSPMEKDLWQESVFGQKPSGDIGAKVRNENPEPTRKEVKAAQIKKAKRETE